MAYTQIRTASAVPATAMDLMMMPLWTSCFPSAWLDPLRRLASANGWKIAGDTEEERRRFLRIKYLNILLEAVLPDMVSVGRRCSFDADRPWLYAHQPTDPEIVTDVVIAWVKALARTDGAKRALPGIIRDMASHPVEWVRRDVNLLDTTINEAGTCVPSDVAFRLLPDLLARRLTAAEPYTFNSDSLHFVPVAGGYRGAELVSWPPMQRTTKTGAVSAYYSATLTLALRTVPFSATPRIHVDVSVRRWVKGRVDVGRTRQASVVLRGPTTDVDGSGRPTRFARLQLGRDRNGFQWLKSEGALALEFLDSYALMPSADDVAANAEPYLLGSDGFTAAVAHHTRMDRPHPVKVGVGTAERRRIITWAIEAFGPEFCAAPPMNARPIARTVTGIRLLKDVPALTKDTAGHRAAQAANAITRRQLLADHDHNHCHVILLTSSEIARHRVLAAARTLFTPGASVSDIDDGDAPEVTLTEGDLRLTVHITPLGALGDALNPPDRESSGAKRTRMTREEHRTALARRSSEAKAWLEDFAANLPQRPIGLLVALGDGAAFTPDTDPKSALRRGFALAHDGYISQFFVPPEPAADVAANDGTTDESPDQPADGEPDETAAAPDAWDHRAQAAWMDLLRQLGLILHRPLPLSQDVSAPQQIAVRVIKSHASTLKATGYSRVFTPVAVRLSATGLVEARIDETEWMPYDKALVQLCRRVVQVDEPTVKEPDKEGAAAAPRTWRPGNDKKITDLAAFISRILSESRSRDTLLFTLAQNLRSSWPWLQDKQVDPGDPQTSPGRSLSTRLHPNLRIVRVKTNEGLETPQWWAESAEGAGLSKGLWVDDHGSDLVYFSTADKPPTMKTPHGITKFTSSRKPDTGSLFAPNTAMYYAVPSLLEIAVLKRADGDDPVDVATFAHLQRFTEGFPSGLKLPLVLHLAKLMEQYSLAATGEGDLENEEATEELSDPEPIELLPV